MSSDTSYIKSTTPRRQWICSLLNDLVPRSTSSDISDLPDNDLDLDTVRTLQVQSTLSKFLEYPELPTLAVPSTKKKRKVQKYLATSAENMKLVEKIEEAKKEKQEMHAGMVMKN